MADVKDYLKESHAGFLFSSAGQAFLEILQREWRERNPPFVPFDVPDRQWTLTFWQRRFVFPIFTTLPQKRRLFWCQGPRNNGKGDCAEFLSDRRACRSQVFDNITLVFRGALNATLLLANMEKFCMRYGDKASDGKLPGLVYCDFMFDFVLTEGVLAALERLTDVGQGLEHGRYKGSEVCLNSHIVVFANEGPPQSFRERCVWLLRPDALDAQPAWEYPFLQPGHVGAAAATVAASAAVPLPEGVAAGLPAAPVPPAAAGGCAVM